MAVMTHLLKSTVSLLEVRVVCVVNVANLLPVTLPSMIIREFTLEKGLMSVVNVENLLPVAGISFIITEFTLEKGLMSAGNVGKVLPLTLFFILI